MREVSDQDIIWQSRSVPATPQENTDIDSVIVRALRADALDDSLRTIALS